MPLFLIFHSLYAIGVKNTNRAVKLKDKRTIIPLAPIPCPLSTTTDVWDPHVRFIFNLEPIGSTTATEGPARAAEARAAPPPRPHAPRPPSGPCRGRRQAGHHARRVLRHRPHPPPHPCSGAVTRCVLCRGPRRVLRRGPRPPRGVPPSLTYPRRRLPPGGAPLLPCRRAGECGPPPSPLGELHAAARAGELWAGRARPSSLAVGRARAAARAGELRAGSARPSSLPAERAPLPPRAAPPLLVLLPRRGGPRRGELRRAP